MLSINDPTNNIRFLNKLYFNPYDLESFSRRCFNSITVQVTTDDILTPPEDKSVETYSNL